MKKITKYILAAIAAILAIVLILGLFRPDSGQTGQSAAGAAASYETVGELSQDVKSETVSPAKSESAVEKEGQPQIPEEIESAVQSDAENSVQTVRDAAVTTAEIDEDGEYTSKDEVALYIHTYGCLPKNYITKTQAGKRGWEQSEGNLSEVLPGMSIGGGPFGNNEGLLPEADGRKYYECDIDYKGGSRNAKRIIYSSDGLIFYTDDHYNSFEQLY